METKEPLNFILDIVRMAVLQNRDADISKVIRDTVSALNCTNPEPKNPEPRVAYSDAVVTWHEAAEVKNDAPPRAVEKHVAPVPKFDEVNENYDPLRFVQFLPPMDNLPKAFTTDEDTVAKINDRTVAMACEHYFDLLAVRDECKQLRDDIKSLRESTLQVFDTYVALRDYSDEGFYVSKRGDTYCAHASIGSNVCYSQNAVLSVAIGEVVKQVKEYKEQAASGAVAAELPQEPAVAVLEVAVEAIEPSFDMNTSAIQAAPEGFIYPLEESWDKRNPSVDASPESVSVVCGKREAGPDFTFHDESLVRVTEQEMVKASFDDKLEVPF